MFVDFLFSLAESLMQQRHKSKVVLVSRDALKEI